MNVNDSKTGPCFSIITPTYNCGSKLNRSLESVLGQDFQDFEYLIIDGNSQDGTREQLAGIKDPRVRSLSEPDKGVYDAMNKAVNRARGRYWYFLGAGDELLPGVLKQIRSLLPDHEQDMIYGNVLLEGKTLYDGYFSRVKMCGHNISHQAIFYGRDVFKLVGDYDLKYAVAADWDLNMRCFGHRRIAIRYVPITVAIFEGGGLSSQVDLIFDADREAVIRRHLGRLTYLRYKAPYWRAHLALKTRQLLHPYIPAFILAARRKLKGRLSRR